MKKLLFLKKHFTIQNVDFFSKVQNFIKDGKNKIYLILDFDRTLTKSQNESGENVSIWEFLKSHLPQKAQKEYQRLYKKYRSLETEGRLTVNKARTWWEKILNLLANNKLKWLDIAKNIEARIPIRPYTKELFQTCNKKNIPTVIISAGIKDIIEFWCQKFEIHPTVILSTNLIFSSKGYMTSWHRGSLIHALNKREKGNKEIEIIKSSRPNTILVGDSLNDASIIEGEKNVLRIAICDPSGDNQPEEFNKKFDLIIDDGTLYSVVEIIKLI